MRRLLAVFIGALLLTSSCAAKDTHKVSRTDEELLSERVRAMFEAKNRGDWDAVKGMVAPEIREGLASYFNSLKSKPHAAMYENYGIKEMRIEGETASVVTEVEIKMLNPMLKTLPLEKKVIKYSWVKREGVWYLIMERPDLNNFFKRFAPEERR